MSVQAVMIAQKISAAPPAGLSVIQSGKGTGVSGGGSDTCTLTTTNGSSFLITCVHESGKTITFSDNKGNSYTNIGTEQTDPSGSSISWAYVRAGTGGASHVFTATSSGTDYFFMAVVEIGGLVVSPLDKNLQASFSGSQPYGSSLPTGTLAQADEICFFLIGSAFTGPYADANNTLLQKEDDNSLFYTGGLSYRIVSATTSIDAAWTLGGSSSCALKTCSFKG